MSWTNGEVKHWFNQHLHSLSFGDRISDIVTTWTGSFAAFSGSVFVVLLWAGLGPHFSYSDTWQLVINTGTTIVTFLMVFLIQNSQNRQTARDRHQAEEDFKTTQEAKLEIEALQSDIARIEIEILNAQNEKLDRIIKLLEEFNAPLFGMLGYPADFS